jgi:hypothetical protein
MVGKSSKAKTKPQITLCDGSNPEVIEEDVNIRITGISPGDVDTAIRVGEQPGPTIITGGPSITTGTGGVDTFDLPPHVPESEVFQCPAQEDFRGYDDWPGTHAEIVGVENPRPRELKFGLGEVKGVVVFGFDAQILVDRVQIFAGEDGGLPAYDDKGRPTNLVIDTGFHGGKSGFHSRLGPKTRQFIGEGGWPVDGKEWTKPKSNKPWSKDDIDKRLSFVERPGFSWRYYAFNKTWPNQLAYIKIWAPNPNTVWDLILDCPDAGPHDSGDNFIGTFNVDTGFSDHFPGWIGEPKDGYVLKTETNDTVKELLERGRIGKPNLAAGSKPSSDAYKALLEKSNYKGLRWPAENKYQEYTTGAGMFAQGGYPLDIWGRPIKDPWNDKDVRPPGWEP